MFARFFVERPIFAMVLSIVIVLTGLVALVKLPIARYPEITPGTIKSTARYLGASADVVADTVATPIEQELNGVENQIYFDSLNTNDGQMSLVSTFEVGTNLDIAQVQVQNKVQTAMPKLPEEVRRTGVTVKKQSTDMLMVISLYSPDQSFDELFVSNYGKINVKDELFRIPGVGDVFILGEREYGMRLWVDPDKLYRLGMTPSDVAQAVQEQNIQAAAGKIGQPPNPPGQEIEYTIRAKGRLMAPEEFADIILRTRPDGSVVRVSDIGRVELGAYDYGTTSRLNGNPASLMVIYQLPGANAIAIADQVVKTMQELSKTFPKGLAYQITYDSTLFVRESIHEVTKTLYEAVILVILVVFIFLQNWRATLIPLLTVPVSLVGTFIFFPVLGFSVNVLTLFGLVLAIGIVVDDAIVVVEAVEHNMAHRGLGPKEATLEAMREVSGALVGIALVLMAVFLPVAFISGITGRLYQQFALTIAISVGLSAFNALTLSPALSALLLRPGRQARGILGRFFSGFNWAFDHTTNGYLWIVRILVRRLIFVGLILGLVVFSISRLLATVPTGFLPDEDEGYFIVDVSLPPGASLLRTDRVNTQAEAIVKDLPGVENYFSLAGQSLVSNIFASNLGTLFVVLKPWGERHGEELHVRSLIKAARARFATIEGGRVTPFNVPPIKGLGQAGGFNMKIQARGGQDVASLDEATRLVVEAARQRPEVAGVITTFTANEPQLWLDLDRERAKILGVPINDAFQALQTYLGGLYLNDFNLYGRTFRVLMQAESQFRQTPEDLERFYVRSTSGKMIPVSEVVTLTGTNGPLVINHFNMLSSADILGGPAPGYSSGQALQAMEEVAAKVLPPGFGYAWTTMAFQEKQAAGTTGPVFIFAVVMVFLLLAAQYESWLVPLAVVFGVPTGVLGALLFVWNSGSANDVYSSIGLVMLVGLIAKNAILIVEFARQQRSEGKSIMEASIEAAHLRLRPILMTSFAFILGVVPLVLSSGAGAASRVSLGTAVFGGMLVGTFLGIFVVPSLYVVFQRISEWWQPLAPLGVAGAPAVVHAADGSAMVATPTGDGSMTPVSERTETPTGEHR
jgi:hydrophobe/amphiphile efflux-1 (HAE1) family protein